MAFNPQEHVIQLKSKEGNKDYLPVQFRLVWFRTECAEGTIETEMVHLDLDRETEEEGYAWNNETRRSEKIMKRANGFVIFRAVVKDGKGGIATATKSEKAASFPDFIEKCESGAIGRALAMLGYGTQFVADELDENHRIADAPIDTGNTRKPVASIRPTTSHQDGQGTGEAVKPSVHAQQQETEQDERADGSQVPHQQSNFTEIERLLDEYYKLNPDWCKKTPRWKSAVIRKALDIPKEMALPNGESYTEDDVHRFGLFLVSKQQEAK